MPNETEDRLKAFVRSACGDTPIVFSTPERDDNRLQLCFVLVGLAPNLILRNNVSHPREIYRRYLVFASGPKQSDRADLVENILFQSLDARDFILEPQPPSDSLWLALGLLPQAAFILRVPVLSERESVSAPPVETIQLNLSPSATLRGRVLDEGGAPLANCVVEIPSQRLQTTTGFDGGFQFRSLSRDMSYSLCVVREGKEFLSHPAVGTGFTQPLTLTLDSKDKEG